MEKPKVASPEAPLRGRVLDDERQEDWRRRLDVGPRGVIYRFPRSIQEELAKWVRRRWPPKVFMRVRGDYADVIVRFRGAPRLLDSRTHKIYRSLGTALRDVFLEILWHAPAKREDTLWSQLANVGFAAYHETWKRVLWLLYGDWFYHRDFNGRFFQMLEKWRAYPEQKRGRRAWSKQEQLRLLKRYKVLSAECRQLKEEAERVTEAERKKGTKENEIPDAVARTMWKQVKCMRGGLAVLGGEVFDEIPYAKRGANPKWEKPGTWRVKQLAIALLAFERHQKYATIERRLRLTKS